MRLFVALDLPYEMRRNLELLLHLLKPLARIQWSALENLHLTTKFIGEFPEARLEELKSALAAVRIVVDDCQEWRQAECFHQL